MKSILSKIPLVKQVDPSLPVEIVKQHPFRLAIRRALSATTGSRVAPLIALSLSGLTTPALGQQAVVELSDLDGSNGFVINGVLPHDQSGTSVSAAGDANGDGFDDLLIGASNAYSVSSLDSGASYVVFGTSRVGASGAVELSALDGNNGFLLNNSQGSVKSLGGSVSTAGDVNGDGINDLLIGADVMNPNGAGYVVFGASEVGASGAVELSELSGSNGFALNGVGSGDTSSISVSVAGDVNGDGVDDVLINTQYTNELGDFMFSVYGASYVVFGASGVGVSGTVELSALDGNNGFVLNRADDDIYSISAVGDINDDSFDDLLIETVSGFSAVSYVVFGSRGIGSSSPPELSALDGSNGFVLNGATGVINGKSVSTVGDVNGDGVDDLLIGISRANPNGSDSGASYVIFGDSGVGSGGTLELSALDGSNGFAINGVAADDFSGSAVSAAGDVNDDGVDDMLISAPFADPNGYSSGTSYVVFGSSGFVSGTLELSALDGSNGFVLNGEAEGDNSGSSVSAAGDINGDGVDDLLIGAPRTSHNQFAGTTYVVFGQVAGDIIDDPVQTRLDIPVSASSDDAEENTTTGKINQNSTDLELVDQDAHSQLVGMRFNGLTIPQGASITRAFVQFQTDETYSGTTSLIILGQATDNASTFTTVNANISSRAQTNAAVDWAPAPWTNIGEAGVAQQTPNIASIIQEIVNRSGWSSGNSLALMISGSGRHTAEAFNGNPAGAPVLHVEYSLGTGNNQAPVVDAGSEQTITLPDSANDVTLNLDGTVSDHGLHPPSAVTISWNKVSGPGTVSFGNANVEDTTAEFASTGTYVLRLTADDGALSNFDEIIIRVNSEGTPTILDVSVSASSDDAEESIATGKVNRGSSDLELVDQGALFQLVGMRFNSLNIPQGATITNASIQFQVNETHSGATSLMIEGEATDNALTFTNANANISSRALTGATIDWAPAPWITEGEAGAAQQTPNIAPIIQEIVERPGWSSGNALVVIISGSGRRNAESFNGDSAGAPVLHVEYQ
jgi:hypothetical protein